MQIFTSKKHYIFPVKKPKCVAPLIIYIPTHLYINFQAQHRQFNIKTQFFFFINQNKPTPFHKIKTSILFIAFFTAATAAVVSTSPAKAGSFNRRAGPHKRKKCEIRPGITSTCKRTDYLSPISPLVDTPKCK